MPGGLLTGLQAWDKNDYKKTPKKGKVDMEWLEKYGESLGAVEK